MPSRDPNKLTIKEVRDQIKQSKHQPSEVNKIAKAIGMGTTADRIAGEQNLGDQESIRQKALRDALEGKY